MDEFIQEVTDYVVERALVEGSIATYYEQNFSKEMSLREFIHKIVYLHDKIQDDNATGESWLYDNEEYEYISENTGIPSTDVIELAIWFYTCKMMGDDCIMWAERCPKCGHDELYEREVEGGSIYQVFLECASCGRELSFDEVLEESDDVLPLLKYTEPDPLAGLNPDNLPVCTDRDAIYRFRVSRKVIELDGTDTLADLSREIQSMYDLDDERISSFYMGKKFFEHEREIRCPRLFPFDDGEPSTAENYEICNLNLYEGQKFLYLNNFMRENRFNIRFIGTR